MTTKHISELLTEYFGYRPCGHRFWAEGKPVLCIMLWGEEHDHLGPHVSPDPESLGQCDYCGALYDLAVRLPHNPKDDNPHGLCLACREQGWEPDGLGGFVR